MLKANRIRLFTFIDDTWTHELTKDAPDWNEAIAALEEARRAGERWGVAELSMIAARGIAAVQDEYLQKRDEALKTLADTAAKVGDGLMVRYQRGMVHYLNKEYAPSGTSKTGRGKCCEKCCAVMTHKCAGVHSVSRRDHFSPNCHWMPVITAAETPKTSRCRAVTHFESQNLIWDFLICPASVAGSGRLWGRKDVCHHQFSVNFSS